MLGGKVGYVLPINHVAWSGYIQDYSLFHQDSICIVRIACFSLAQQHLSNRCFPNIVIDMIASCEQYSMVSAMKSQ